MVKPWAEVRAERYTPEQIEAQRAKAARIVAAIESAELEAVGDLEAERRRSTDATARSCERARARAVDERGSRCALVRWGASVALARRLR